MDISRLIKSKKWHLFGKWKEPGVLENSVSFGMVNPPVTPTFTFRPKMYLHLEHNQFVPKEDFSENVEQMKKIFDHDLRGATGRLKANALASAGRLDKISSIRPTAKDLNRYFDIIGMQGRWWYEIMVADSALQQLYPQSLPKSFKLCGQTYNSRQLFAKVALPKKLFPMISERYDLLSLAVDFKKKKNIFAGLKSHVRKYSWMNSLCWWDEPFSAEHYLKEIRILAKGKPAAELKNLKAARAGQYRQANKLLKELKHEFPLAYDYIDIIRELADLKEENWDAVSTVGVRLRPYFKKIAADHFLSYNQFLMLTREEMLKLLAGKFSPDVNLLNRRAENFGIITIKGKKSIALDPKIVSGLLSAVAPKPKKTNELKGIIIWEGKVRGRVRRLNSADEVGKMKTGEILVCPMTDPDYMPAIRKAKAVVTDQGGLLCHAAIVARELRIPCLVGTEFASKLFKDGDLVEVDANKGIVKKI